jgi:Methyltransferase domain
MTPRSYEESHYLHGTAPCEQDRLSRLNDLLNERSLQEMALRPGDRVLDVGSGLGQLTRGMARQVGPGRVVGIERSNDQLAQARLLASRVREDGAVDFRQGDAASLPFLSRRPSSAEWFGQFGREGASSSKTTATTSSGSGPSLLEWAGSGSVTFGRTTVPEMILLSAIDWCISCTRPVRFQSETIGYSSGRAQGSRGYLGPMSIIWCASSKEYGGQSWSWVRSNRRSSTAASQSCGGGASGRMQRCGMRHRGRKGGEEGRRRSETLR